ncbi:MAG: methylase, partial [Methanocorpusculum sp.]|nr:methylase [Methanocorpusculum sp.]
GYVASAVQKIAPHTVGVDSNPHAVSYAHEVYGVDTIRGDLFSAVSGEFDLILFNAPYLPTLPEERLDDWLELALSGGESGREVIERFLPEAVLHLAPEGRILLLISSLTGLDAVRGLCRAAGCTAEVADEEREEDGEMLYVLRIQKEE